MGQIVGLNAKPKRANLNALSLVPTPANGEYILVSSDNSMNAAGQGNFDSYIQGNGTDAATVLPLKKINQDFIINGVITDFTSPNVSYYNASNITFSNNDGVYTYAWVANGGRAFVQFPQGMNDGETYIFNFSYTKSKTASYPVNMATTATGSPILQIQMNGLSGNISYTFQKTSNITGFYIASSDIGSNGTATLSNISVTQKVYWNDIISKNTEDIEELKASNDVITETIPDFSSANTSTMCPDRIAIENNNGQFLVSSTSNGGRAYIAFPSTLKEGTKYFLSFDFIKSANRDVRVSFAQSANATSSNYFYIYGSQGSAEQEFTADATTIGFYVASTDIGSGNTLQISNVKVIRKSTIKDEVLSLNDSVNDVNEEISDINRTFDDYEDKYGVGMPEEGLSFKYYQGNCLRPNLFGYKLIQSGQFRGQSIAISGDILFAVALGCANFGWMNLKTRTVGHTTAPFLSSANSVYHANSCGFSNVYYSESDKFPLLYIGGGTGNGSTKILVARIVEYNDNYVYHMELVQEITIPPSISENVTISTTYSNINVTAENDKLYIATTENKYYICSIPSIFDGNNNVISTYTMTDSEILKSYNISEYPVIQDMSCLMGCLYITHGGSGSPYLAVICDGTEVNHIDLSQMGIPAEPEGLDFWGKVPYYTTNANMYVLYF